MNRKIKVIEFAPSMLIGGAENVAKSICQNIDRQKFDVKLVTMYSMKEGDWPKNIARTSMNKKRRGVSLKIFVDLIKLLKKEKPCIIHVHYHFSLFYLIPANLLSSRAQIVQTIHNNLDHYNGQKIWKWIFTIFGIWTVNLSPSLNLLLQKRKRNFNIANGIKVSSFKLKDKKPGINNKFLFIGRLEPQKDPFLAINIFKQLHNYNKNFKFNIVGTGSLEEEIRQKIKESNVSYINFVNEKVDPLDYFKTNDYLILSSCWEGMPLTVIEAMAANMIIFAKPVGAVQDLIIDKENGFLLNRNSPKSNAKLIVNHIKKSDLKKVAQNAKLTSERFTDKIMTEKYEELFEKIAKMKSDK